MMRKIVLLEERYENHNPEKDVFGFNENNKNVNSNYIVLEIADLVKDALTGNRSAMAEIKKICSDADGLLVNLFKIDAKFIENLDKCKVIGRYGIGYDSVDIKAASAKGIKVVNVPEYCTDEVSEHIIALLFSVVRNVAIKDRLMRQGKWNIACPVPVHRIAGKKFGIIGYGKTGQALHQKVAGLGFSEIIVYDRSAEKKEAKLASNATLFGKCSGAVAPKRCNTVFSSFEKLLSESDFISLNLPLTEETNHIIGEREFRMMKNCAIIINTARGAIIDTKSMIAALKSGEIAGAALDVYESEPLSTDSPLLALDNVVMTDHAAWYSAESQIELQIKCAQAVKAILEGRACDSIVN